MQFSLGLAAGSFISQISAATRGVSGLIGAGLRFPVVGAAVGSLIGSVSSLGSIVQHTFGAIEKGAELNALHKRTGESVSDLFRMEKGFKAARVGAENMGTMLFNLQKSLGGFNEMGEPTKDIFAGIGLSVEELKKQKAPEQLEAIFKALAKLNNSEAATAAGKIFGRGGGQEALQLARSGSAFGDAMRGAAEQAALFARNAEAFEKIELSIGRLKSKFNGVFANIAEGAATGIQALLDKLNGIDLTQFGQRVGKTLTLFANSWKAGNFGELIGLTLQAGFEKAINWLFAALKAVAASVPSLLEGAKQGVATLRDKALAFGKEQAAAQIGARINNLPGNSEEYINGRAHQRQLEDEAQGYRDRAKSAMQLTFDNIGKAMVDAIDADKSNVIPETAGKRLRELLNGIVFKAVEESGAGSGSALSKLGGSPSKVKNSADANALERIGGLFFAGGGSVDYSQKTADNTARTAELLSAWLPKITNNYRDTFGNLHTLSKNL